MDRQKESFTAATSSYFAILSSLDVSLRRQIHALQEAGILPAEASSKDVQPTLLVPPGTQNIGGSLNALPSRTSGRGNITGGGLGSLDVGWLNSRNDHTGKEHDAGLWEEARKLVENHNTRTIHETHDLQSEQ